MIPILDIWNRVLDYGKKHQSGIDIVKDFNGKIAEAQTEIRNAFVPYLSTNDRIDNILSPFFKIKTGKTISDGFIQKPSDYYKVLSVSVNYKGNNFDARPLRFNEIGYINRIPQRTPDLQKKRAFILIHGSDLRIFPNNEGIDCTLNYLSNPPVSKIAFNYSEDLESDELVMTYDPVNSVDLSWNMDAFNLFVYIMLEKYGMTNREMVLTEYARLGVTEGIRMTATNVQEVQQ